jgi:iron complex outermembrane receptor protein
LSLAIAAASLVLCGTALAQPAAQETIDTIVVTGSRSLERSILESPVPVDTFDAEDVRDSGARAGELGEALATLVPSFNFLRQSNSGTSDHVRAGQLRGLSPDQMLVLVNGKRRHTSAVVNSETKIGRGTAAVDFNTLPLNAVHHVEVLRDGAGAQYGSDAIDEEITDGQTLTLDGKAGLKLAGGGFLNAGFDMKRRNATDRAGFDTIPFFYPATPANLALKGKRNYAKGDPQVHDANL